MYLYELRETTEFESLNPKDKIQYFQDVARECFIHWNIPQYAHLTLLNYTENATFKVTWDVNQILVMRIHRIWYTSMNTIRSEISWIKSLLESKIKVPSPIETTGGDYIVSVDTIFGRRYVDCQRYEEGQTLCFNEDVNFEKIGEMLGNIHNNSSMFKKPKYYSRIDWDYDKTFSHNNNFHNELYLMNKYLSIDEKRDIQSAALLIKHRLETYGKNSNNYGLIHSDCRFANILKRDDEYILLDFDDCGDGWYMYDLASVFGFNEDHPYFSEAQKRLFSGYLKVRILSEYDIEMFDTFILMRRIGLIGTGMFFEKYAICGPGENISEVEMWHKYYHKTAYQARVYCNEVYCDNF